MAKPFKLKLDEKRERPRNVAQGDNDIGSTYDVVDRESGAVIGCTTFWITRAELGIVTEWSVQLAPAFNEIIGYERYRAEAAQAVYDAWKKKQGAADGS